MIGRLVACTSTFLLFQACGLTVSSSENAAKCSTYRHEFISHTHTALESSWDGSPSSRNIWLFQPDGTKRAITKNVASANGENHQGVFTPDGKKIVFNSNMSLNGSESGTAEAAYNTRIMNADGSDKVALTRNTMANLDTYTQTVSPDGTKIAIRSKTALSGSWNGSPTLSFNLWIMNIDGSELAPITQNTIANLLAP